MKNKNFSLTMLPPEIPKIKIEVKTQKYTENRKSQFVITDFVNPELAYLAGALRDGAISKTKTNIGIKYYIAFCNTSYKWLNDVIRPILEKLFQIKMSEPFKDRESKYQIRIRKHGIVQFFSDLFEHPFGKQADWRTPSWILNAPKEIKKWYIRGFFDSEGGCGNVVMQKEKYPWQSIFFIAFHGSSLNEKCIPLEDVKRILSEDFGISSQEIKQDIRETKNGYLTKLNIFYFKITKPTEKMKFFEVIGSSHPEKYNNLVALSEMIAAQS